MKVNIKATNMDLTDSLNNYVVKRLESVEKYLKNGEEMFVYVEIGKTTNHHKQGEVYKAEFDIKIGNERHFTVSEREDLFSAIDNAKNEAIKKITHNKDRKQTLFKRGAISVKKMVKGFSKRNPFTSK